MRAAMMGNAAMLRELLAAPVARRGSVNAAVTGGLTALHFALNGRMNQMQDDALVRQLQGQHEECMALLLDAGADPMVGHLSALWYAASYRNYEMLALTVRAGANTNDRADGGWSLLHEVSASKASGMARFFMKPAIDPQLLQLMRLQPLSTPQLHGSGDNGTGGSRAAESEAYMLPRLQNSCQSDDLVLLIEHGAVVDWQDEKNRSALHVASGDCVLPAVRALLQAGANPNLRGPDGASPLHRAVVSGHGPLAEQTAAALLEAGADPLQLDDYGRAPTEVASTEKLRQQLWRAANVRTSVAQTVAAAPEGDALEVADNLAVATEEDLAVVTDDAATVITNNTPRIVAGNTGGWSALLAGDGVGRLHGPPSAPRHCDFDVVDAAEMDNVRFRR
jgi:ankyrin repeat protein